MGMRANAAREMLAGVYDGLDGRVPNERVQSLIDDLHRTIREDDSPACYCGAHNHGGDCMCNEY